MSDTITDGTRTLHAVPTPEPLAGLTGAPAAIYAELVQRTGDDEATAAELALAAGLGRSTTGKALVTLEEHGLAVRTPGGHDGRRRTPDRWRAARTPETSGEAPAHTEPASSLPETGITDAPDTHSAEPDGDSTDHEGAAVAQTTPDTLTSPDDGNADAAVPATEAPQDAKHGNTDNGNEDGPDDRDNSEGSGDTNAPALPADTGRQTAPTEAIILHGEKKRLAPGGLRDMVIDHLQAHPGEAFTATKISRVIGKSSGAIANALVSLARQGIAEQVSERPRAYRLATPENNA
ncbi:IclR-like helix-turn-helix domain-containing protein [Streptomyces sp. Ag109_O5-1]|uniref:MarR family transcriptional regulator n=1 Tax=Streptomyces sp. Ag109_O5-1 TaxID=1938851 RepID=UPI000F4F1D24|nr:MarR family transcriptional regulator [Streptomyces sp. Ag109_O5-1]RPE38688.1 IclR-like helix-turn-helix domain-containing protein [Streptomyces sp. Ag109_O5-1]